MAFFQKLENMLKKREKKLVDFDLKLSKNDEPDFQKKMWGAKLGQK